MSFKVCSQCVMDSSAEEIVFDDKGVCNFCHQAQKSLREIEKEKPKLTEHLAKMKSKGQYDVLIGLSGGVDSSYALCKAVELGLRPLCFSVDNGWNTEKADANILKLVETLQVPFIRYTIDLKQFLKLQSAFMKAGVKNIEIPTDHILMAVTYKMASEYGIKWIISGGNTATESIMPPSWGYNARDLVHIKDIYKKMIGKKLKGLPVCGLLKWNYYRWIKRIKLFYLLDYLSYNRDHAIKYLQQNFSWEEYGDKHQESTFTWWFQTYYLFEKFGIDKRKAHYSSLINSGQMTRKTAMDLLTANPIYPQTGLEMKVMNYPRRDYREFKTDEKLYNFISKVVRKCKSLMTFPQVFTGR